VDAKEIYASLEKLFPGKVGDLKADVFDPYLSVDPAAIVEVCRFLRTAAGFRFEVLSDLTALDWPKEEKIQVVYHLFS
jgi:NADH-quinone oxidoreductase subunit C